MIARFDGKDLEGAKVERPYHAPAGPAAEDGVLILGDHVTLEQAYHRLGSEHSCVGCHAREAAKRDCAGCHHGLPQPPGEHSCVTCHNGPAASCSRPS